MRLVFTSYNESSMQKKSRISEKQERALRVINAFQDNSAWKDTLYKYSSDPYILFQDTIEKTALRLIDSSAGLIKFLKAALLVRKNYRVWVEYLENVSASPPEALNCIAKNQLLVLFLFLCDSYEVFHLNPSYPFLDGCHHDSDGVFILCEEFPGDDMFRVVKLWLSMGSPELNGYSKFFIKQDSKYRNRYPVLFLAQFFWRASCEFGLDRFIHDEDFSFEEIRFIWFKMNKFKEEISVALSFDNNNELLEIIQELFPQYPEIICDVCREYHLSAGRTFSPNFKRISNDDTPYYLYSKHDRCRKELPHILAQRIDYEVHLEYEAEEAKICHKGIKKMIQTYPQLFETWKNDTIMSKVYEQLMDESFNHENYHTL